MRKEVLGNLLEITENDNIEIGLCLHDRISYTQHGVKLHFFYGKHRV